MGGALFGAQALQKTLGGKRSRVGFSSRPPLQPILLDLDHDEHEGDHVDDEDDEDEDEDEF